MRKNILKIKIRFFIIIFLFTAYYAKSSAQTDTVNVPGDISPNEGNLNNAIQAVITSGSLSRTVFKLELNGYYILTRTITIPAGQQLTIIAPEPYPTPTATPPQILWTSNDTVNKNFNFDCYGNITLKNIWLLYANTNGIQEKTSLQIEDSRDLINGQVGIFEDVIFDYSGIPANASGAIGVTAKHFRGTFKNCYFKNCIDQHFRYYGRAVSFPYGTNGWHIDSLLFENCTFANLGYIYSQEEDQYADVIRFNHCTFLNTMLYTLESGSWYKISITNSIYVNSFMYGDISSISEIAKPNGGTIRIDSIKNFQFEVPFTEQDRRILFTNNSYYINKWLRDYYSKNPFLDEYRRFCDRCEPVVIQPQPMLNSATQKFFNSEDFPYMNAANLYDSTDPGFLFPPTNEIAIKKYLYYKWGSNNDTNWAYNPLASISHVWPMKENLVYSNSTLLIAGINGFPLGDLYHWFPSQYQSWKAQESSENMIISQWLNNGLLIKAKPPALPKNLIAVAGNGTVTLQWRKNTESDFLRYYIYYDISPNPSKKIDSTIGGNSDTIKIIRELENGKTYYFRITAIDKSCLESDYSNEVIAKPSTNNDPTIVNVPSDISPNEGNLNRAIQYVIDSGNLSNTVFNLEYNGYYILTSTITIPLGTHLTIIAPEPGRTQETAPPQILWSSNEGVKKQYIFNCLGDISLKNIWLLYGNTSGDQISSSLCMQDNINPDGQHGNFESVIFDYSSCPQDAGGAVSIDAKHFKGIFKNCYFKNCTDRHYRYYGRALSFPFNTTGWHSDSVTFENCTFANIGYVYMQEGGEYSDYVKFNHCTFLNVVMYSLESGWWNKLAVTNSIFVNCHMFGDFPAYRYGSSNKPYEESIGGTIRIDSTSLFGFPVLFSEQDRRILFTNSSYFIEKWLRDWMYNNPYSAYLRRYGRTDEIPVPQPILSSGTLRFFDLSENGKKIFPFMNRANLYDSIDPGFILAATDSVEIKDFLYRKWDGSTDTLWGYFPELSFQHVWPMKENLRYTNSILLTAGLSGFPLGDLYRWFPDKYIQWKSQEKLENARITNWLETGKDAVSTAIEEKPLNGIPSKFVLEQNYPNPFNPTTQINYSVPNECYVSLKVYNLLGQEVATLTDGIRKAGNYVATFEGAGFSNGVYLYRLIASNFMTTKKLLLLK